MKTRYNENLVVKQLYTLKKIENGEYRHLWEAYKKLSDEEKLELNEMLVILSNKVPRLGLAGALIMLGAVGMFIKIEEDVRCQQPLYRAVYKLSLSPMGKALLKPSLMPT